MHSGAERVVPAAPHPQHVLIWASSHTPPLNPEVHPAASSHLPSLCAPGAFPGPSHRQTQELPFSPFFLETLLLVPSVVKILSPYLRARPLEPDCLDSRPGSAPLQPADLGQVRVHLCPHL